MYTLATIVLLKIPFQRGYQAAISIDRPFDEQYIDIDLAILYTTSSHPSTSPLSGDRTTGQQIPPSINHNYYIGGILIGLFRSAEEESSSILS